MADQGHAMLLMVRSTRDGRNLLVHLYWEVDNGRVWDVLNHNLVDLRSYLDAIGRMMAR